MLYPIKFKPRVKERIWGGHVIAAKKGRAAGRLSADKLYGESWDISSVAGDVSVVSNGFLKGNNLEEIVEVYMGDLVGERVFDRFGVEFPLLVKYLDCNDVLSVQVHPDDALAADRHNAYGKTEMWYVVDRKPGAALYIGFKNRNITREEYIEAVAKSTLPELLNRVEVEPGDVFFIPAGVVHALGAGIEVVEIQQTSDITYRIYDWDRVDAAGKSRELHTALAVDAIDFSIDAAGLHKTYAATPNAATQVVACAYFTTSVVDVEARLEIDRAALDSFTIYICISGEVEVAVAGGSERLTAGEVVLIPAESDSVVITGCGRLLETYVR